LTKAEQRKLHSSQHAAEQWAVMASEKSEFVEQGHALQRAIDEDKRQIEESLAIIQRELDQQATPAVRSYHEARATLETTRHKAEQLATPQFWLELVRQHPWRAVGVGFAAGFWIGSMWG
jgi:ElaB/YqjD/DUF883 family membrane-anchored ribosome-binding protein